MCLIAADSCDLGYELLINPRILVPCSAPTQQLTASTCSNVQTRCSSRTTSSMADAHVKFKVRTTRLSLPLYMYRSRNAQVTAKIDYKPPSRPASPTKSRTPTQSTPVSTPTIRPRAKVSSSATVGGVRKPAAVHAPPPTNYSNGSARAASPTKLFEAVHVNHGRVSPSPSSTSRARVTARVEAKSNGAASVPPSPRLAHFRATPNVATTSDTALNDGTIRTRHASISSTSHVSGSSDRVHSTLSQMSYTTSAATDTDSASYVSLNKTPMKVKAKVSGLVKSKTPTAPETSPPQLPSPTTSSSPNVAPIPRQHRMGRTASISSLSSREPLFYPITTASPIANAHRFATTYRPPPRNHHLQPSPTSPVVPKQTLVDPATVPLPPLSPPGSTVSFSSRSTTSRSSVTSASHSTVPTFSLHVNGFHDDSDRRGPHINGDPGRARSNSVVIRDTGLPSEDHGTHGRRVFDEEAEAERKLRAEAKSNRKVCHGRTFWSSIHVDAFFIDCRPRDYEPVIAHDQCIP